MKGKYKFKVGGLYKIKFYDHSIGTDETMTCEVVGWCLSEDDIRVLVTHWQIVNTKDEQMKRDNVEYTNLLRSTIISVRKLL